VRAGAGVKKTVLAAGLCLLASLPVPAIRFRLPLDADSGIHFYYDHDSGSGTSDWKCGTQTYDGHPGTDFTGSNATRGTPIYAAGDGTVNTHVDGYGDGFGGSTDGGGAGNHVVLNHSTSPQRTHYLHMLLGTVTTKSVNSSVSCGEQIGKIGTSGNSTGNHVHFEPRVLSGGSYLPDDPYAGTCGGPTSFWVDQTGGSPTTSCQGEDVSAPSGLTATTLSTNRISLSWTDNSFLESNFQIERANYPTGPWTLIGVIPANSTSFISSNLLAGSTFFYRVKCFNSTDASPYSNVAYANTSNTPPTLGTITDKSVLEGRALSFNASAVDLNLGRTWLITDFDSFADGTANGTVMFHEPGYSITSRVFEDASPNLTSVSAYFPVGNGSRRTLLVNWSFANSAVNPWLRLSTQNTPTLPNPALGFGNIFRFDIFTERSLKVGLGIRESGTSVDPGQDGGVGGTIEFVGVGSLITNTPVPTRTVDTRSWQHVELNIPTEPVQPFTGDGVLQSPTGKGALEHLIIVPDDGNGEYRVWLDNFSVTQTNIVSFSLDPGAPVGASINPVTGAFSWTPGESDGPGVYPVTIRVTDNGYPPMSDAKTFNITVVESNLPPVLAAVGDKIVNSGSVLTFTNSASDPDLPGNALTFSLDTAPGGAAIGSNSGIFIWSAPAVASVATNGITIRVTDNGTPPLSDTKSFQAIVVPPPQISGLQSRGGTVSISWAAFPGKSYRVQFTGNLTNSTWLDFGSNVTAANATLTLTNLPGTNSQGFYRVQQID
jgi:murein DD-endopeptidase MepM/ murein hydrolase activator NlpD